MCLCKRTILIVDNREQTRRLLKRPLEHLGYNVITAESADDALNKAKAELIHLALIDVRLEDDLRLDDFSGIHLFAELSIERKILMTAWRWPNPAKLLRSVLDVRHPDGLKYSDFIDGHRYLPREIFNSVDRAFSKAPVINMDLELKLEPGLSWEAMVRQMRGSNGRPPGASSNGNKAPSASVQTLRHVSCMLFSAGKQKPNLIKFISTTPGYSPCTVAMVRPYFKHVPGLELAAKFGPEHSIRTECDNFNEFVVPYIPFYLRTHLEYGPVFLQETGALAYDLVGKNVKSVTTLREHYGNSQVTDAALCQTLTHLFKDTCAHWYEHRPRVPPKQRLDVLYRAQLNLQAPDQVQKLKDAFHSLLDPSGSSSAFKLLRDGSLEVQLNGRLNLANQKLRVPDPIKFCFETRCSSQPHKAKRSRAHQNFFPEVDQYAITHGDLHSGNVVVYTGGASLIDFYKTGVGHALRDFAEMESDIKFTLFSGSLSARYELERALLRPNSLRESVSLEKPSPSQQRALSAIETIRQQAFKLTDIESTREYYMALLFYAVKGIRGFTSGSLTGQSYSPAKAHALLSAAMLCQRLSSTSVNKRGAVFLAHDYRPSYRKLMHLTVSAYVKKRGFDVVHPLDDPGGNIWLRVAEMIEDTDAGLYEISVGNGNVYFELGYAIGKHKPYFALIRQKSKLKRPPLISGDLLYEYSSEHVLLTKHVRGILEKKDKWENRFYYLKPEFKTKLAQVKVKPRSAVLLVANTPRQKKKLAPRLTEILRDVQQRNVQVIPVEQQVNVEDFVLKLGQMQLVVGCLASDGTPNSQYANAELALALGIAKGMGKKTIILQEKDCDVLTDLMSFTITFRGLKGAAEALEAELSKAFPNSRHPTKN